MRGKGTRHVVWVVGAALFLVPNVLQAKSNWQVESRHLRSYEQARDCSVFKSVAWNALSDQRLRQRNAKSIETLLKSRRAVLEQCGNTSGLSMSGNQTEDEDRVLAEMCPGPYSDWLTPGYRLHSIRSEIREYDTALETIRVVLRFRCGEKEIREINWNLPRLDKESEATGEKADAGYGDDSIEVPSAGLTKPETDLESLPGASAKLAPLNTEFEKAVE